MTANSVPAIARLEKAGYAGPFSRPCCRRCERVVVTPDNNCNRFKCTYHRAYVQAGGYCAHFKVHKLPETFHASTQGPRQSPNGARETRATNPDA